MMQIKAVGFDFDNTLMNSENSKSKIFEEIFYHKYGIRKGVADAYKKLAGKINREEKIVELIKKFLKREPKVKEIKELSYEFSRGYEYRLSYCPLMLCTNILGELKKQVKFTFLVSLENRDVVVSVAKHCGIAKYFDEILGGPKSKIDNFKHVMKMHGIKPEEMLYIGDSSQDIVQSKKLKMKAIGIQKNFSSRHLLDKLGADFTFSTLCDIPYKRIADRALYTKELKKTQLKRN
jgi:phosphoglycolate phosphatase-like HAD superfamily hydrolase